jgi:hypothetical protein
MAERHDVQHCRWAEPTLFLQNPLWTAAEKYPWSCHADGVPRPVEDTHLCTVCGRWAAREPAPASCCGSCNCK